MSELSAVRRSARALEQAQQRHRAAILAAVESLEAAGRRDAYATVARAAGVTRQSLREMVERART